MEAANDASHARDSVFEGLHAEASAAVGHSANTIRQVREQYRSAYAEALSRWQDLREELDGVDHPSRLVASPPTAEAIAPPPDDAHRRSLRSKVESLAKELEEHRSTLARLELAEPTLSRPWLF